MLYLSNVINLAGKSYVLFHSMTLCKAGFCFYLIFAGNVHTDLPAVLAFTAVFPLQKSLLPIFNSCVCVYLNNFRQAALLFGDNVYLV